MLPKAAGTGSRFRDPNPTENEEAHDRILKQVAEVLRDRSSQLVTGNGLDPEFRRQAKSILAEARDMVRGSEHPVPEVSVEYPAGSGNDSTGRLRAEQNLHPAESLMAAEILFDVALPVFASDRDLVRDKAGEAIRVARALHHAIWRRFPPGAIAYAEVLRQRLSAAHYESRIRLSRDLHDRIAHSILSGMQRVELAIGSDGSPENVDEEKLNDALEILRGAVEEVQGLAEELRQRVGEMSVADALAQFINRDGGRSVPVVINSIGRTRNIQGWIKEELFTIAVEAIRNAWAHANGSSGVYVSFIWSDQTLSVVIRDDGQGFDVATIPDNSIGVKGMNERAKLIGAQLTLRSDVGSGTCITLVVPIVIALKSDQEPPAHTYPNE